MATMVKSFAIQGIDGYPVELEVTTLGGQPMLSIIGLGDQAVKEAGERIQAALDACGYDFPKKKVIISLAPGDKKKRGSHFDLAMAIALLQQTDTMNGKNIEEYGLIGELALNGTLRSCTGILPMIMSAAKNGIKKVIVPNVNLKEAKLVHNITAYGFEDLTQVRKKVEKARKIQQGRFCNIEGVNCNAQMTTSMIKKYCALDAESLELLKETCEKYAYSARVVHKMLRLARTSADLEGIENIRKKDVEKVLLCRDLDKSNSKMMVVT